MAVASSSPTPQTLAPARHSNRVAAGGAGRRLRGRVSSAARPGLVVTPRFLVRCGIGCVSCRYGRLAAVPALGLGDGAWRSLELWIARQRGTLEPSSSGTALRAP
ncbi:hypothetical protein PAHAL_4G051200 [Panicum hallii]|uniref:Uncharacterized protein n=1 Tax=Panicum hallii TaxID=206008 RepID=A0A2T8JBU2_9POAL|nr:hypothetical protein PAHAL_4G051200 [Panicum hallii]